MAVPLITKKIVKKHVMQFKRTLNDWKIFVKPSWRRPKGIDFPGEEEVQRLTVLKIAHNVSTQKRKEIVERTAQLDIVVTSKLASRCFARLH
ncbi:hypothetical protein CsSME_00037197 [Camellia sinensis var. sinensis]